MQSFCRVKLLSADSRLVVKLLQGQINWCLGQVFIELILWGTYLVLRSKLLPVQFFTETLGAEVQAKTSVVSWRTHQMLRFKGIHPVMILNF